MIIALAGRRVDPADAKEQRFPLDNVESVRTRARAVLKKLGATALVSSAAWGADLIALSEAGQLGLRRRVILPFERRRFRETSVTDRPGEWGPLYDQVLDAVEAAGKLAGLTGKPRVIYPRHRFSIRDLLSSQLGLAGAGSLLPALPSLRTPLYLMP